MRSQFKFNIARGGCWSGKVQRYLRAAGLDSPVFLTDAMRQRHIHPRHKRGQIGGTPGQSTLAVTDNPSVPASGRGQPISSPFAAFGKKSDAPAS